MDKVFLPNGVELVHLADNLSRVSRVYQTGFNRKTYRPNRRVTLQIAVDLSRWTTHIGTRHVVSILAFTPDLRGPKLESGHIVAGRTTMTEVFGSHLEAEWLELLNRTSVPPDLP